MALATAPQVAYATALSSGSSWPRQHAPLSPVTHRFPGSGPAAPMLVPEGHQTFLQALGTKAVGSLDDVLAASSRRRPRGLEEDRGMEQLRSELQVAQLQLTMAEGQRQLAQPLSVLLEGRRQSAQPLSTLLAPLDRLLADCNRYKDQLKHATCEWQSADSRGQKLAEELSISEATAERASRESEAWQQRCRGLERECAMLAMHTDTTTSELQATQRRERSHEARALQQRLTQVEAQTSEAEAWVEARGLCGEAQQLERALAGSEDDVGALRTELLEAQEGSSRAQAGLVRLEREHGMLQKDRDAQHEALQLACESNGALSSRCESLEAALRAELGDSPTLRARDAEATIRLSGAAAAAAVAAKTAATASGAGDPASPTRGQLLRGLSDGTSQPLPPPQSPSSLKRGTDLLMQHSAREAQGDDARFYVGKAVRGGGGPALGSTRLPRPPASPRLDRLDYPKLSTARILRAQMPPLRG